MIWGRKLMVHTPAPPAPQVQHHRCHTRAIAIAPASVTVYGPGVTTHPGHNRSLGRVRLLWPGCGTCGAGPVGRAGPVGDPSICSPDHPNSPYITLFRSSAWICLLLLPQPCQCEACSHEAHVSMVRRASSHAVHTFAPQVRESDPVDHTHAPPYPDPSP